MYPEYTLAGDAYQKIEDGTLWESTIRQETIIRYWMPEEERLRSASVLVDKENSSGCGRVREDKAEARSPDETGKNILRERTVAGRFIG